MNTSPAGHRLWLKEHLRERENAREVKAKAEPKNAPPPEPEGDKPTPFADLGRRLSVNT